MSTEHEKLLRERIEFADGGPISPAMMRMLLTAARIGAEIEREECAEDASQVVAGTPDWEVGAYISNIIRARGNKQR